MANALPSASELLQDIANHPDTYITVGELVERFRRSGFALLLIVFALPMALPLPALGVATVLSLPLLILSVQVMVGRQAPWVPAWLARKKLSMFTLRLAITKVMPYFQKAERYLHPRGRFFVTRIGQAWLGLVMLCCSISVALPFPFTNTLPSMGVVVMGLGLLERDGRVIWLGILFGLAGMGLIGSVYYFGAETVKGLFF